MNEAKQEALYRLEQILCELDDLGNEAAGIMREHFRSRYESGDAYGAFTFGSSSNRYDTTLSSMLQGIQNNTDEYEDEEEEAA
tara:strand:+ start:54 stop:302 length:249 start_codon:yes stop_codon:yes gene_type:complete